MVRNLIRITWRNLNRHKAYSLINIFGFALGLTLSILLGFYVVDDLTFDRFHENARSIYRLLTIDEMSPGESRVCSIVSGPLMLTALEAVPEVAASTRFASGFRNARHPDTPEDVEGMNIRIMLRNRFRSKICTRN